jgi:hypothetical protein
MINSGIGKEDLFVFVFFQLPLESAAVWQSTKGGQMSSLHYVLSINSLKHWICCIGYIFSVGIEAQLISKVKISFFHEKGPVK